MFHHDTESRLLLARERVELLASEMRVTAGDLARRPSERRAVESRHARKAGGLSAGVRPA